LTGVMLIIFMSFWDDYRVLESLVFLGVVQYGLRVVNWMVWLYV